MAKLIVKHRVADFDVWKRAFLEHGAERRKHGFTGHSVLRDDTDPNIVTCVLAVGDLTRAKAFLASQDLHDTMARAGVQGPPEIYFCKSAHEEAY